MDASTSFRLAVVQMDPFQAAVQRNAATISAHMEVAAGNGAKLAVFPECALSGYVYESAAEAQGAAIGRNSPLVTRFQEQCARLDLYAVIGLLEIDETSGTLYNSALIVGPTGPAAWYRKTHLPVLGIDRYVGAGDALPVFDLPFGRIGVLICYDVRFPEATRSLALRGIDLLAVPTNWPVGAESAPEFLTRARAWENRIYLAACNRVGVEHGVHFIGRSQVVSPDGRFLATADTASETILYAEIDVQQARKKKLIIEPGIFELDPVGGRRPELYADLLL